MDKYSRKTLKYLNHNFPKLYSSKDITKKCKINDDVIDDVLTGLIGDSLIKEIRYLESNGISTTTICRYKSTLKGLDYFKSLFKKSIKNFFKALMSSILCPIIVSIITTLLTLWLT